MEIVTVAGTDTVCCQGDIGYYDEGWGKILVVYRRSGRGGTLWRGAVPISVRRLETPPMGPEAP